MAWTNHNAPGERLTLELGLSALPTGSVKRRADAVANVDRQPRQEAFQPDAIRSPPLLLEGPWYQGRNAVHQHRTVGSD